MKEKHKWYVLDERTFSNLLVILIGILFYLAVSNIHILQQKLSVLLGVITPFVLGFTIAYLLNTPMIYFERKLYSRFKAKRVLSIITVYLAAVLLLVILFNLVLPQVGQSIMRIVTNFSVYLDNLNDLALWLTDHFNIDWGGVEGLLGSYQDIMRQVMTQAGNMIRTAIPGVFNFGMALGNTLITLITALISSIYLLSGKDKLVEQMKKIIYAFIPVERANRFLCICRQANHVFVGFINGKLLDSAIIGVLCFLLCTLFRIELAVLVSLIVGVTNIIPFFGPIIGAVPCMMILLMVDPLSAFKFAILVIALQQFDGNILGPKILGDSTGLSPIWVLVAIVVGGGLFGFPGMILGVPTFAVIYSLVREWVNDRLQKRGVDGDGNTVDGSNVPETQKPPSM